jgi:anti-sigma B factor antagonist
MTVPRLHVTAHHDGARIRLAVSGELDVSTRDEFITAAVTNAHRGAALDLDLSEVSFCDTMGISALVAVGNIIRGDGGSVQVTAASPTVTRILGATDLVDAWRPV